MIGESSRLCFQQQNNRINFRLLFSSWSVLIPTDGEARDFPTNMCNGTYYLLNFASRIHCFGLIPHLQIN